VRKIIPSQLSDSPSLRNERLKTELFNKPRDLLDHVIAVNERDLKRLLSECGRYYHENRTHPGLKKELPAGRIRTVATARSSFMSDLAGRIRLGFLLGKTRRCNESITFLALL
jgi:hypothetical protein